MRKLLLRIVLAAALVSSLASGQTSAGASTPTSTWSCFPGVTLTDSIYWTSQPLPVQALRTMSGGQLTQTAVQLAQQGYKIDNAIMVWQWDPVCTMGIRQADGYTWVPSLLQTPVAIAPGITLPGVPAYDPTNPPAGSIKVSTDAADYPPIAPPPPPVSAPGLVGPCYNGGTLGTVCAPGPAAQNLVDGQILTSNGKSYLVHSVAGLMGTSIWLTPQ